MTSFSVKKTTAWAFYDFANTIFSAIVLTSYFPLYLTKLSGSNWELGTATTLSMVLAGLVMPFLGGLSDQTGKTKKYLIWTTILCNIFLVTLGLFRSPTLLIIFFVISCIFYHASLVFYNSMLPFVAPPEKQGFASGLGTGLGYLGVVLTLPMAYKIEGMWGMPAVFILAAGLFLLCSLPLFLCVPERPVKNPRKFDFLIWREEWQKLFELIKELPQDLGLLLFLGGNFFVVDALNSVIFWFLVYTREVFHPEQFKLIQLMLALNACAFVWGLVSGWLTDRLGAMKTFLLAAVSLSVTIALLSWVVTLRQFTLIALTGGAFALAGVWTAGRKALVQLVPEETIGGYFGIYGLTTKISVVGSLMFSILADTQGFRSALGMILFPAVTGMVLLFLSAFYQRRS